MYAIIRDRSWLVVEWKSAWRGIPFELTKSCHDQEKKAVETAMNMGAATVVATCKRREDARILARELNHREKKEQEWRFRLYLKWTPFFGPPGAIS